MISDNLNIEAFNNLSEQEKQVALEILKQYSQEGNSELLEQLKYYDFEEIPVDITTFLHDRRYLGNGLYDNEGRFTVFPYWEKTLQDIFPDNLTTKYNTIILHGAIGIGKAQPLDSLVLTEFGFKKMGELSLVDKVFGRDGKLHNILGIFPQGKKQICRVTFTDNTSTLCCDQHLWTVYNTKNKAWTTIETRQLLDGTRNLNHATGHRYKIPMTTPVAFNSQSVSIDPYVLGVLIGDGSLTTNAITFASADKEIIETVRAKLATGYELRKLRNKYTYSICKQKNTTYYNKETNTHIPTKNIYTEAIQKLALNTKAQYKHIPTEYLINDVETRIALLQGLMDTDGSITKDGSVITFTTTSAALKDDFVFLVQSLGGICHIRTKTPKYFNKKYNEYRQGLLTYNIGIKLPKSISPFKLTRKVNRLNTKALEPFRYIKNIEYVDKQECQCIYIDSEEHLYLTNDFIVTHNTLVAVLCVLYMLYRLLCLKDPYTYYGMQLIDKLSISFMNITLENAKGVALDKMNQLILSSEWFLAHGEMSGKTNLIYRPNKHIEFVTASSNNQIIGRAIFCLDGETIIKTTEGYSKLVDLVDKDIKVISVDDMGKKVISDRCTVKPTIKTSEEYQIELEDGTIIKCTSNHKLLLKNGSYKEAQNLTEEDELAEIQVTYEEFISSMKIKSIKKVILAEPKQYYDIIEAAPYHNFIIKTNNSEIISHNCNFSDEVNFAIFNDPEKQKKKMMKLLTQVDARQRSRFLRGTYLPTLNILASSADTQQSFLQAYIKQKREAESTTTLIVEEPQWVVDSRKDTPEKFYVGIGNRLLPNELFPLDVTEAEIDVARNKGYQIWKVPMGYLETFQQNLDEAICSIIGISTDSSLKYISGDRLQQIKVNTYLNPFIKDIIEVGNGKDDFLQYANFFDKNRINPDDVGKPLFIHLDLSLSGDKTGIAGTWITGKRPTIVQQSLLTNGEENTVDYSLDLQYKLAFSVSIKAPKGTQVSFEKTRTFIRWLRDQGFAIKVISADTYNSAPILQELKADGFRTEIVSVDRVDARTKIQQQYAYFKSAIYERRVEIYEKCDLLTEEILQLERLGNGKIEHEDAGKRGSKDQCDAFCGSLWSASRFAEEYSYSYGDNLSVSLDANSDAIDNYNKQQFIAAFEQELQSIQNEFTKVNKLKDQQQQEEWQYYQDISDGIIVIN